MTPTAMRSGTAASVENVENGAAAALLPGRREKRAESARGAPLPSDHFAEVVGRHFQLDDELIAAIVCGGLNRVGVVDERFGDELDQLFHELLVAGCRLPELPYRATGNWQLATIACSSSESTSQSGTTAPPSTPSSPRGRGR